MAADDRIVPFRRAGKPRTPLAGNTKPLLAQPDLTPHAHRLGAKRPAITGQLYANARVFVPELPPLGWRKPDWPLVRSSPANNDVLTFNMHPTKAVVGSDQSIDPSAARPPPQPASASLTQQAQLALRLAPGMITPTAGVAAAKGYAGAVQHAGPVYAAPPGDSPLLEQTTDRQVSAGIDAVRGVDLIRGIKSTDGFTTELRVITDKAMRHEQLTQDEREKLFSYHVPTERQHKDTWYRRGTEIFRAVYDGNDAMDKANRQREEPNADEDKDVKEEPGVKHEGEGMRPRRARPHGSGIGATPRAPTQRNDTTRVVGPSTATARGIASSTRSAIAGAIGEAIARGRKRRVIDR